MQPIGPSPLACLSPRILQNWLAHRWGGISLQGHWGSHRNPANSHGYSSPGSPHRSKLLVFLLVVLVSSTKTQDLGMGWKKLTPLRSEEGGGNSLGTVGLTVGPPWPHSGASAPASPLLPHFLLAACLPSGM